MPGGSKRLQGVGQDMGGIEWCLKGDPGGWHTGGRGERDRERKRGGERKGKRQGGRKTGTFGF